MRLDSRRLFGCKLPPTDKGYLILFIRLEGTIVCFKSDAQSFRQNHCFQTLFLETGYFIAAALQLRKISKTAFY